MGSSPPDGNLIGSPAIGADGTLYVGGDNDALFAVNPADGSLRWEFKTQGPIYGSPALDPDGTIYVGSIYLHAVRPTGTEKWRFQPGALVRSSPAVGADGTVYFGCDDRQLYAVDTQGKKPMDLPGRIRVWLTGALSRRRPVSSAPMPPRRSSVWWRKAARPTARGPCRKNPKHHGNAAGLPGDWHWDVVSGFSVDASPASDGAGRLWMAMNGQLQAFHPDGTVAVPPVEGLFAAQGPIIGDPDTLWMASIAGYNPARSELVAYDTKDLRLLSRLPLDGFVPHRASMALASDGTVRRNRSGRRGRKAVCHERHHGILPRVEPAASGRDRPGLARRQCRPSRCGVYSSGHEPRTAPCSGLSRPSRSKASRACPSRPARSWMRMGTFIWAT